MVLCIHSAFFPKPLTLHSYTCDSAAGRVRRHLSIENPIVELTDRDGDGDGDGDGDDDDDDADDDDEEGNGHVISPSFLTG